MDAENGEGKVCRSEVSRAGRRRHRQRSEHGGDRNGDLPKSRAAWHCEVSNHHCNRIDRRNVSLAGNMTASLVKRAVSVSAIPHGVKPRARARDAVTTTKSSVNVPKRCRPQKTA
jgi:hypothetical protein